jgi:ATP-dependent protease HslVU (ClpYQ) peptidase subunit
MSVIAARKYKDRVDISADSQITWGSSYKQTNTPFAKLIKQNKIIIGSSGTTYLHTLLSLFSKNTKPKGSSAMDIFDYLVDFRDWAKKRDATIKFDTTHLIIIYLQETFVCYDLEINIVDSFASVGSGMFLAIGAMHMGAAPDKAVEIAKEYDLHCGGKTISYSVKTS